MGVDAATGQPILTNDWIDRLAPRAAAVLALGTCAAYGGIPAMRNNPTGAMGLRDYLGWDWQSRLGIPVVNLPGLPCPAGQHHRDAAAAGAAPGRPGARDRPRRPGPAASSSSAAPCTSAATARASPSRPSSPSSHGDGRCLVKLGCTGPVVRCNVPMRGWVNGVGGCPNVGGICMACTMPGFPDRYMPFMEPDAGARLYARTARFAHGPFVRYLRNRRMRRMFDVEPEWRRRGPRLTSGYEAR